MITRAQSPEHVERFALIAQLDVTANAVLPALTPTDSWVMCVTATVTDTHHCRHVQTEIVEGSSSESAGKQTPTKN